MAVTPFKAVHWNPDELISEEKMDQFGSNEQWLKENRVEGLYTLPSGAKRAQGVKVAGGRVIITPHPKSNDAVVRVRFSNFFTNKCQPLITTGIVSGHNRTFCVIKGLNSLIPDDNGFEVQVTKDSAGKKKSNITKSFYINWIALGY